jgi:murein DD-endopeptidase MepM/ murein hydrolase activator NlpD
MRRTSFFGDRRVFKYSNGKTDSSEHYGIDFGVPIGTEVYSVCDGIVVMAENRYSTGNTVIVEAAPGLYSLFYHLDSYKVKIGQHVTKGELIALSGQTGLATGPHLHWEMRLYSVPVNPDYFVEKF